MAIVEQNTASNVWVTLLKDLLTYGQHASPRGMGIKECLGYQTRVDMCYPLVTVEDRKMGFKFAAAEAAWILSGDSRVSTIAPYSKSIAGFSDNGLTFFGAYGPKITHQIDYLIETLTKDPDTRQAVINIWRENPPKSKDIPCSLSVQFLIRNNQLHCQYTMRSSDAWLGWVYDVFNFSMLSAYVCLKLRQAKMPTLDLGCLTLTSGSQHLYDKDQGAAAVVLKNPVSHTYPPVNLNHWKNPEQLVSDLWDAAAGAGALVFMWEQASEVKND